MTLGIELNLRIVLLLDILSRQGTWVATSRFVRGFSLQISRILRPRTTCSQMAKHGDQEQTEQGSVHFCLALIEEGAVPPGLIAKRWNFKRKHWEEGEGTVKTIGSKRECTIDWIFWFSKLTSFKVGVADYYLQATILAETPCSRCFCYPWRRIWRALLTIWLHNLQHFRRISIDAKMPHTQLLGH